MGLQFQSLACLCSETPQHLLNKTCSLWQTGLPQFPFTTADQQIWISVLWMCEKTGLFASLRKNRDLGFSTDWVQLLCFIQKHTAFPNILVAACYPTVSAPWTEWGFCFFFMGLLCFVLWFSSRLVLHCFFPIVVDGLGKEITAGLESLQSSLLASWTVEVDS